MSTEIHLKIVKTKKNKYHMKLYNALSLYNLNPLYTSYIVPIAIMGFFTKSICPYFHQILKKYFLKKEESFSPKEFRGGGSELKKSSFLY